MSEYQYYEFQAIDRPLDGRAMTALRAFTSRDTITPTSLVNVYHWGDFKGDPDRLMDQSFDAHLYVANWGTRRNEEMIASGLDQPFPEINLPGFVNLSPASFV